MGEPITRKVALELAKKTHDRLEQDLKDEVEREAKVPAVWEDEEREPLNADNFEERYREWVAEKFKRFGR
jgi:hypothetical protein